MHRLVFIIFLIASTALAADGGATKINTGLLMEIPLKRHMALMHFAISAQDGSPAIADKKAGYVHVLKTLIQELHRQYYWHAEFPAGIDQVVESRAIYLAGLHYPASPTTGASYYGDLIQNYTIRLYEEEIVIIAHEVIQRLKDRDIVTVGELPSFTTWEKSWTEADNVNNGPNQDMKRLVSHTDLQ